MGGGQVWRRAGSRSSSSRRNNAIGGRKGEQGAGGSRVNSGCCCCCRQGLWDGWRAELPCFHHLRLSHRAFTFCWLFS